MVTVVLPPGDSRTSKARRSSNLHPSHRDAATKFQPQAQRITKCPATPQFPSSAANRTSGGGVLGSLAAMSNSSNAVYEAKHDEHVMAREASEPSPPYRRNAISNFYVPPPYRRGLGAASSSTTSGRVACSAQNAPVSSSRSSSNQPDASQISNLAAAAAEEEAYRRQRTTDFKVGRNLFNRNPEQGMAYLILRGFVQPNPNAIATMFSSRLGLNRQRIGEFLSTPSNQSQLAASVLSRLSATVDMSGVDVDISLRRFLALFHLPGEAQRIERILRVFAHHYCVQNESAFAFLSSDCSFADKCDLALLLAYAIVMLNTDLHSPAIRENRMSQADFVCNFQGAGKNAAAMPAETLASIYERIRLEPLTPSEDNTTNVSRIEEAILDRRQPLVAPQRRLICYCCLVELRGDPLRGCQKQQQQQESKPAADAAGSSSSNATTSNAAALSSNRRCSFPASFAEGLRNRQSDVKHGADRQLFLFNDLLVVTKLGRRRGGAANNNKRTSLNPAAQSTANNQTATPNSQREVFLFRRSLPLLGLSLATFTTPTAPFGIRLTSIEENAKSPSTLFLCARTEEDHQHFVQDLQEAIAEATLTEAARLDLEKCPKPILDKLFDPSDLEDANSMFSEPKTASASSLVVSEEVNVVCVQDCCSTPTRSSDSNSGSSSSSGVIEEGAIMAAASTTARLSRRHSRTSLDSGVGEIGSQVSIAVATTTTTTLCDSRPRKSGLRRQGESVKQSQHQLYGSRSAEKHVPDCAIDAKVSPLSPEPSLDSQTATSSSSNSSSSANQRCRARSVDTLC